MRGTREKNRETSAGPKARAAAQRPAVERSETDCIICSPRFLRKDSREGNYCNGNNVFLERTREKGIIIMVMYNGHFFKFVHACSAVPCWTIVAFGF
jgi:hypothetical protein